MADLPTILTCRACRVDVSVSVGSEPRCPRCQGPLVVPTAAEGDAPDATLLELKPSGRVPKAGEGEASADRIARAEAPTAGRVERAPGVVPLDDDDIATIGSGPLRSGPPPQASSDGPRGAQAGGPFDESIIDTATQRDGPPALKKGAPETTRRLGPYELRRVLGRGGMGIVYEAWQPALERAVALKVMSTADAGEEELARFEREARAAARLQHPHIVPIFEVGQVDGRNYFTMELVRGRTLQELARQTPRLAPERTARLVSKVAHAIHFAHERGIIHRDLKPSNVLVDEQDEPHVMDFGLAKDVQDQVSGLTLSGIAMGSPPYMPPEQARGEFKLVDAVSDVYGLGAILYECLTGSPPFTGKSAYDVIAKVLVEDPPAPRSKNPDAPVDLETICLKALEKEKWRRYASAKELGRDLERLLEGRSIVAVRHGLTTRIGRGIERHRSQLFAVLLPLALAAALAAYTWGGREVPPASAPAPDALDRPGPIGAAALRVSQGEDGIEALLPLVMRRAPPRWGPVRRSLESLPEDARARRAARPGRDDDPIAAPDLERLVRELVNDDRAVPDAALGPVVVRWILGDDDARAPPPSAARARLADLVRRAALAQRGVVSRRPEPYRLALEGPRGPLDHALVRDAATQLLRDRPHASDAERRVAAVAAVTDDEALRRLALDRLAPLERDGLGRIVHREGGWVFPPVRVPADPADVDADLPAPRPIARGLVPARARRRAPTSPLLSSDGRSVVVGWLRFLWVLDEATGRVVGRARLPGVAMALEHGLDAAWEVEVWDGAARTVLVGDDLVVREPGGAPVHALDLLPRHDDAARDELRRLACALVPALDDAVDVEVEGAASAASGPPARLALRPARRHVAPAPPGQRLELGFLQGPGSSPGVPVVLSPEVPFERAGAAVITSSDPTVVRAGTLLAGDVLRELTLPALPDGKVRLLIERRTAGGVTELRRVQYDAKRRPIDWRRVAEQARAGLAAEEDRNPWLLAFAAVAGAAGGQGEGAAAERMALLAATSPHPTPRERIELGCLLDRHGLEGAADAAFTRTLEVLLEAHAYAPMLAGYGELDCGRPLADRAERARLEGRAARADALCRWRDALAPALGDGPHGRAAFARAGVPPPPAAPAPRKGVAGLDAPSILRVDHTIRLQATFVSFVGGLLLITLFRYRRHAARDLTRLGHADAGARMRLWLTRPRARLAFAWPTYVTLNDKLAFIALYLVYFLSFAVQDAGFDALVALKRGHDGLLGGLPATREELGDLEADLARQGAPDEAARAYALLWGHLARGAATDPALRPLLERCAEVLARRGEPRDHLLRAELDIASGAPRPGVRDDISAARRDPATASAGALLLARLEGRAPPPELEARVAESEARHELALRFARRLAMPLAPPVSPDERDRLVTGTTRWWSRIPALFGKNLFLPGSVDASLRDFEQAWSLNLEVVRLRNSFFWVVPASLLLLVASLLVRTPRMFEPLAEDLRPSRAVRLLSWLAPGVPQFMRGRPVRGALLLAPFLEVAQTLYHEARQTTILGWLADFANMGDAELAALTGETTSAVAWARHVHLQELALALAALYALHWLDLALGRRKVARATGEKSAPVIVAVDSLAPAAKPAEPAVEGSGPFDRTGPAR